MHLVSDFIAIIKKEMDLYNKFKIIMCSLICSQIMNLELQDLSINMLPNNNNKEKAPMFSECFFKCYPLF